VNVGYFVKIVVMTGDGKSSDKLDVLLTVHHSTLRNQYQIDTFFLVCLLGVYMFRALLVHLQEALHKCYLV
jgi:hypothetical protein